VARSRHKNFVELTRGATPYGILIEREPRGKPFRGGVGQRPMVLEGGRGMQARVHGWHRGPSGGGATRSAGQFARDGRTTGLEQQAEGRVAAMRQGACSEEAGALMVALCRGGDGSG
jgi:hypothetical protein